MKKQTLILALMLVFSISVNIFAGDSQSTGGDSQSTGGKTAMAVSITSVLTQILNLVP